jgi:metallo-beta-lactamase family protein
MENLIHIKFFGAAETVTGSKTLVSYLQNHFLIDCGLFQGNKELRLLNWETLPFDASNINFVLLTHGHLDHCGWLPILVKNGFHGKIYCTEPTKKIVQLILLDSAKIQEEEAAKANKENYSKHHPAKALYTIEDAKKVFPLLHVVKPNEIISVGAIQAQWILSGHILGASSIQVWIRDEILVFSGDIGQTKDALLYPPQIPEQATYVFLESTYGNRLHATTNPAIALERYVHEAFQIKGTIIIPSFAVERAQLIMYYLWQLKNEGRLPNIPMYLDTPMGISVLDLFAEFHHWHRLELHEYEEMCACFEIITTYEDTLSVIENPNPKIVIAASGMATGGRILSYFERYLSDEKSCILLVGYQAEGTRGRKLLDGEKSIKMYGNWYQVKAKILQIDGLSAHADQQELIRWINQITTPPKQIFLVHAEEEPLQTLKEKLKEVYQGEIIVPKLMEGFEI